MHDTTRYIGRNLRALRIRAHMSQADVARELGLSQPQISKIENGENETSLRHLADMAALYGTTLRAVLLHAPAIAQHDAKETELITLYRRLSPDSRQRILGLFREVAAFTPNRLRAQDLTRTG